mmetsp:Transcript_21774/g.68750  ORF Transcript_21774/g.68750 Transcript_21774/m.68750 type:complete len:316 (-) Transcript_21774:133-1080(-)
MTSQQQLLSRLTELLQEVDSLQGETQREERVAASRRVEAELEAIEAEFAADADSPVGKQQAGLIALVRSALQTDRENGTLSNWNDDGLLKDLGVTTYASQAYWDDAYAGKRYGDSFDWYGSWEEPDSEGRSLASLLRPFLNKDSRILMLGCGNSNMSALMHREGFRSIVNVDISEPVIRHMQERYGGLEGMSWRAMSAAALDFGDGSFDVAIEKGLFDALFAGTGSQAQPVLAEARRVLRPRGRLLSVSFAEDRIRRLFAPPEEADAAPEPEGATEPAPWSCEVAGSLSYKKDQPSNATKGDGGSFYVYSCEPPA